MANQAPTPQGKAWCFTLNGDSSILNAVFVNLTDKIDRDSSVSHFVVQEEKAPSTGQLHLQGYIRWTGNKRLQAVKTYIGDNTVHVELAKGSAEDNLRYCTKPDTATGRCQHRKGDFSVGGKKGQRNDLKEVTEKIKSGASLNDIAFDHPEVFVRNHKGLHALQNALEARNKNKYCLRGVIFIEGDAGCGKSRWVREWADHNNYRIFNKVLGSGTQWWDQYDGQEVVLLDDFDNGQLEYREFLRWADIYPVDGQVKGGMVRLRHKWLVVTTNLYLKDPWPTQKDRGPLERRVDNHLQFRWSHPQLHCGVDEHKEGCKHEQGHHFLSDKYRVSDDYKFRGAQEVQQEEATRRVAENKNDIDGFNLPNLPMPSPLLQHGPPPAAAAVS